MTHQVAEGARMTARLFWLLIGLGEIPLITCQCAVTVGTEEADCARRDPSVDRGRW